MDTKQQTAVNWLFKQLWDTPKDKFDWYAALAEAERMEWEQIIEAANWMPEPFNSMKFLPELAEQYYNEKYRK